MNNIFYIIQNSSGNIIDICTDIHHVLNKYNFYIKIFSEYNSDLNTLLTNNYITIFSNYTIGTIHKENNYFVKSVEINNTLIEKISSIIDNYNKSINISDQSSSIFIKSDDNLNIKLPLSVINHSLESNNGTITTALDNCDNVDDITKKIKELTLLKEKKKNI